MKILLVDFEISIHAPPRGATVYGYNDLQNPAISIHAPPRGATGCKRIKFKPFEFQFTPLREGRRLSVMLATMYNFISIHAPPRGATTGNRQ